MGLVNKDGSTKTECGIHVAGAEKTFDRDLWEGGAVKELATQDEAFAMKDGVMVVYAPWCQFCQGMEEARKVRGRCRGQGHHRRQIQGRRGPGLRPVEIQHGVVPHDQRDQGRQGDEVRVRGPQRRGARRSCRVALGA